MTSPFSSLAALTGRDLAEYGIARVRDQAFDAVQQLWRKRRDAGATQKALAEVINRDPGWVSKNLRAPGNWTLRTVGELVQALNGEVEIKVYGLEDLVEEPSNFDAYDEYTPAHPVVDINFAGTISAGSTFQITIGIKNDSIPASGSPT
jgi:hypothetical protein